MGHALLAVEQKSVKFSVATTGLWGRGVILHLIAALGRAHSDEQNHQSIKTSMFAMICNRVATENGRLVFYGYQNLKKLQSILN